MSDKIIYRLGIVVMAGVFISAAVAAIIYQSGKITKLYQGIYWGVMGGVLLISCLIEELIYRKRHPRKKKE